VYGEGRSEKLLGQTLRTHGNVRLTVATKIPPKNMRWPAAAEYDGQFLPPRLLEALKGHRWNRSLVVQ
jgi:aryl-alcohol dehydrogenase-like predicted oxidoreductase